MYQRFVSLSSDKSYQLVVPQAKVWHTEEKHSKTGFGKVGVRFVISVAIPVSVDKRLPQLVNCWFAIGSLTFTSFTSNPPRLWPIKIIGRRKVCRL